VCQVVWNCLLVVIAPQVAQVHVLMVRSLLLGSSGWMWRLPSYRYSMVIGVLSGSCVPIGRILGMGVLRHIDIFGGKVFFRLGI